MDQGVLSPCRADTVSPFRPLHCVSIYSFTDKGEEQLSFPPGFIISCTELLLVMLMCCKFPSQNRHGGRLRVEEGGCGGGGITHSTACYSNVLFHSHLFCSTAWTAKGNLHGAGDLSPSLPSAWLSLVPVIITRSMNRTVFFATLECFFLLLFVCFIIYQASCHSTVCFNEAWPPKSPQWLIWSRHQFRCADGERLKSV